MSDTNIKEVVKEKYGQAALRATVRRQFVLRSDGGSSVLVRSDHLESLRGRSDGRNPEEALLASLGCGNPTALAKLNAGETVLDLGSGGGIDVLLSAKRVGPTGKAYGLDMTDEMLALANENQAKAGVENVEFLKGEIENIPLAGQFGGCGDFELRDQSFDGQGPRAARSVSRAEAGRTVRGFRCGDARRDLS